MRREEEGPSKMHERHSTQHIGTLLHTISRARLATLWQESVSLVQQETNRMQDVVRNMLTWAQHCCNVRPSYR